MFWILHNNFHSYKRIRFKFAAGDPIGDLDPSLNPIIMISAGRGDPSTNNRALTWKKNLECSNIWNPDNLTYTVT
jgi:hypothetical protein